MARFTDLTLFVEHVDLLRDWYVRFVGLSVRRDSEGFVLLEGDGGARLGFHRGTPLPVPEGVRLQLEVDNVDALYDRLRGEGVTFVRAPENTPWGHCEVVLRDPAGHTLVVFSPLRPSDAGSPAAVIKRSDSNPRRDSDHHQSAVHGDHGGQ